MDRSWAMAAVLFVIAVRAAAQEEDVANDEAQRFSFDLEPVLLDAQDGEGSTVGLQFEGSGLLFEKSLSEEASSTEFDPDATISDLQIAANVLGTVAADSERNPKNYLSLKLNGDYLWQRNVGTLIAGAFYKYEANQGFDSRQSVYGLELGYAKRNLLARNDALALRVHRGEVDPSEDEERAAVLGTSSLDKYYRTDFEALYLYQVGSKALKTIFQTVEFNYRYFRESGAPDLIKAAHIDRHRLITYRIGLPKDLFIAYSSGKLPFDRKDDHIYEIGLSYKLR